MTSPVPILKEVLQERKAVVRHLREHAAGYRHGGEIELARVLEKKADQIEQGEHRRGSKKR